MAILVLSTSENNKRPTYEACTDFLISTHSHQLWYKKAKSGIFARLRRLLYGVIEILRSSYAYVAAS